MERSRQGADGSSPSGRQSPGAPWGTNARTASSVERTPVARLRPVARTPALRSPLGCSPALRSPLGCSALLPTPLRRAPRGGPMHSGLPDSASPHSSTPALLPTAPPFQKSAANRSPALRTPAMRALRPAADPPTALRPSVLRSSVQSSHGSKTTDRNVRSSATKGSPRNRTRDLPILNPQLRPLGQRENFLPSIFYPCLSLLGAVGRPPWCARAHMRSRLTFREVSRCSRELPVGAVCRTGPWLRAGVRARTGVSAFCAAVRPIGST